ncbi:MAG: methionine biosynthesis protein MetW [Planctomycetota bacterium]
MSHPVNPVPNDHSAGAPLSERFARILSSQTFASDSETAFMLEKIVSALESAGGSDDLIETVYQRETQSRERVITADYDLIASIIPSGAKVLDLGCGDGELLQRLRKKNINGCGVEIDPESIVACIRRHVPVIHANIDEGLSEYGDKSYDYVILNRVLQQAFNVDTVLKDMLRVGKRGIVSFPNFGYWAIRLQLALTGIMPVSRMLPFNWYDTPNIRLLTINDFLNLVNRLGLKVIEKHWIINGQVSEDLRLPNIEAEEAFFILG